MKIKKIGHCCLLIKTNGLTILTDPGAYSDGQNSLKGIDIILITHEHPDHLHSDSVKEIMKNNPHAVIITNSGVGKLLDEMEIAYQLLEGSATTQVQDVSIEAFDGKHEEIFEEFGQVQNTGYFIDKKLFYPGDSYINPQKKVDVLALPVAGAWCKVPDAIRYALAVKPLKAFPVHDGMIESDKFRPFHFVTGKTLSEHGIHFTPMKAGEEGEF